MSSQMTMNEPSTLKRALQSVGPFVCGGLSGAISTSIVQPMDFIKTQLQLAGEGTRKASTATPLSVAKHAIATEGVGKLYTGITAAWLRQIVYGSARLGLFRVFSDELKVTTGLQVLPVYYKMLAGMGAGALGAFIGNPADLSLVRMQADASLPVAERRNYTGVVNAMSRIIKEEGVLALWRGSSPTMIRAMVLNTAMMTTSDQTKEMMAPYLGGLHSTANMVTSAVLSGVIASVASLPFDMIKTRLQKMKANPDGTMPYKGFFDCAKKIAVKEGFGAFYKGVVTYIFRIGPHSMFTLILLDNITPVYKRVVGNMA